MLAKFAGALTTPRLFSGSMKTYTQLKGLLWGHDPRVTGTALQWGTVH